MEIKLHRSTIWARKNPDKARAIQRRFNEKHPGRAGVWTRANPEKNRVKASRWYYDNHERAKEIARNWAHKNQVRLNELRRLRRLRGRDAEKCDPLSSNVLAQLVSSATRMKCGICGKNMPKNDRTVDHVIPLSKGGTGNIGNLRIVHLVCNIRKGGKLPHIFSGQAELHFHK